MLTAEIVIWGSVAACAVAVTWLTWQLCRTRITGPPPAPHRDDRDDPARERIHAPLPRRIPPARCGDCGRQPCTRHDVRIRDLLDRYDKELNR